MAAFEIFDVFVYVVELHHVFHVDYDAWVLDLAGKAECGMIFSILATAISYSTFYRV